MRLETDNNDKDGFVANQYTEDRLNQNRKRKKSKFRGFMTFLGYLAVLILIMCVLGMISTWAQEKQRDSVLDLAVSAGAERLPEDKEVTMTEAELNAMIEEAVAAATAGAEAEKEQAVAEAGAGKEQAAAEARTEVLEGIKAGLSTGDESMVEVLRPFYPNDMVVVSGGKFHFVPIDYELKQNSYDDANLNILESGEYQYAVDGQVVTHKGIDVSRFQGNIDWNAVAADGVEFAFIRVGNRGYGTGKLVEDSEFDDNMKGALDAGINVGVYIYSQAVNEDEIREEFQLVMDKIAPYNVKCPIVFDVEKTADASGRMNQLSVEERTNLTLLFCQLVEQAGHKPIIYHNVEMGALMIDVATLENYDKWLAYYNDDMYYPYEYKIWQYSDKGRVNGIDGDVDLNICFEPFWE